jgi:hypothetical protein
MDSRSRQNHRSKKSWVPNVEINPLEFSAGVLPSSLGIASMFWNYLG